MLLLRVKFGQLKGGHVVDEKVVTNLAVCEDSLLMSLGHSLSEDSGVFSVEEQVDSCQLAVFSFIVVPTATEDVTVFFIS